MKFEPKIKGEKWVAVDLRGDHYTIKRQGGYGEYKLIAPDGETYHDHYEAAVGWAQDIAAYRGGPKHVKS